MAMKKQHRHNQTLRFDDKEHEALMGLWWTGLLLKKRANTFFKKALSSEAQFNVMMVLRYSEEPLTQNQLSEKLLVDKSNITGLVDRMAKAGLIHRIPVPHDRRCYHVELTAAGRDMLDQIEQPYRQHVHQLMAIFSLEEITQIIGFTERLQDEMMAQQSSDQ
jgi:DNA-binding MarR family transcriptional regulator